MSFFEKESSHEESSPVELYTISYKQNSWLYVNSDYPVTHNSKVYEPLTIVRSNMVVVPDKPFGEMEVELPRTTPVLDLFRVTPPSGAVTLQIDRMHLTDSTEETSIVFKGNVVNVERTLENGKLLCQSSGYMINRVGLRKHYQYLCPHMLYGDKCGLNRSVFRTAAIISTTSGSIFTSSECVQPEDNYYAGGYVEYVHATLGTFERISIASSVGTTGEISLFSHPVGLNVGASIDVFRGCDRTFETCRTKFANTENFGGFPFIPTKNPFNSNPTF